MKIALSKGSGSAKYLLYSEWLKRANSPVDVVDLSVISQEQALTELERCSGIVFTGGEDVVPERYGKPEDYDRCKVDHLRDELEFALVHKAHQSSIPMLGVCRGAQVLNVAFGGTLIVDIPTDFATDIEHRAKDGLDSRHDVEMEPGSVLKKICGVSGGEVNSAHHQAVEQLANYFSESAKSSDGLIEAFETAEPKGNSFVLAVQWHPERMEFDNPLSLNIVRHFLFECESFEHLIKGRLYFSTKVDSETGTTT